MTRASSKSIILVFEYQDNMYTVDCCSPIFDMFTNYVCFLFCSHIVLNIMEFYAIVIQLRGSSSYKTWFNPPFYIRKGLYQVKNMTIVVHSFDEFELLILPFD